MRNSLVPRKISDTFVSNEKQPWLHPLVWGNVETHFQREYLRVSGRHPTLSECPPRRIPLEAFLQEWLNYFAKLQGRLFADDAERAEFRERVEARIQPRMGRLVRQARRAAAKAS